MAKFRFMTDFNVPILTSFMISGYKFILYHSFGHFAIIRPCRDEVEAGDNSYIIPIQDEEVYDMACGVDEFSFYVLL